MGGSMIRRSLLSLIVASTSILSAHAQKYDYEMNETISPTVTVIHRVGGDIYLVRSQFIENGLKSWTFSSYYHRSIFKTPTTGNITRVLVLDPDQKVFV